MGQPAYAGDCNSGSSTVSRYNVEEMLKSHTISGHLIRGVVGFGFLAFVLVYGPALGWWTLIPAAGVLVAFRG